MNSPEKLATFLSSAVRGNVPEIPKGLVLALRTILAARRSLLKELLAANPDDIDSAMVEIAKLSLSMRSDDAPALEIVEFLEETVSWEEIKKTIPPEGATLDSASFGITDRAEAGS